ncbi:MAG: S8 family peptidase [Prevotella sp.]|nr:S8 family peptidase [Prevotella sp.]
MKKIAVVLLTLLSVYVLPTEAQRADYAKMSSLVRQIAVRESAGARNMRPTNPQPQPMQPQPQPSVCAFVRIEGDGGQVLSENGCRQLARFGDIYIADIPVSRLRSLSLYGNVKRIEAGRQMSVMVDTTAQITNVIPLREGTSLPQAYTGKGVIMGLEDIGFDLTNPNFFDNNMQECRIKRFWDQLSPDTIGSQLYVGQEYTTAADIQNYRHSRDALLSGHGNHTLGIAAGTGCGTPYRGIAYESDICLVSNAVTSDTVLIDETQRWKYTTATDALGFKYIFDYAERQGMPCVISFSEGSYEDLHGNNQLFSSVLSSLTGPGRIFVASAGNEGHHNTFFRKPRGVEHTGAFFRRWGNDNAFLLKSDGAFSLRMLVYESETRADTLVIPSSKILSMPDSLFTDTVNLLGIEFPIEIQAYPSGFNPLETAYDFYIQSPDLFGYNPPISFEIMGADADVCLYRIYGEIEQNAMNPLLTAGECTHSVFSPGSSPTAICVGATTHRHGFFNHEGDWVESEWGDDGMRATFSSVGPTIDERIKPDVVAPGNAIVSSFSSFYREANPESGLWNDVSYTVHDGRRYPWYVETGTSMSTPVVAGIIALWLEANPNLTPEDVKEIFRKTCRRCDETLSYPNNYYGYGEIDAYRGLLEVLQLSGIPEISHHNPQQLKVLSMGDGMWLLHTGEAYHSSLRITVYDMQGVSQRAEVTNRGNGELILNIRHLPRGVYAVQLNASSRRLSGSFLVRR